MFYKYKHAYNQLYNTPLLITSQAWDILANGLDAIASAPVKVLGGADAIEIINERKRKHSILEKIGNVAVISIHGVIDKTMSEIEAECFGGCSLAMVDAALNEIATDELIEYVVLYINSPGGSTTGIIETAARIAALRESKEIHCFIDNQACSAGYWLASQADHIAINPSASTGSVGVYRVVANNLKQLEKVGIEIDLIKAGKHKALGASFQRITEEEKAILDEDVKAWHERFKKAVTELRTIPDEAMQGLAYDGIKAKSLGLVDEVTILSLDEYVGKLLLGEEV